MTHTKVLAALSLAMILGAAPAAMAAHKPAHTAKAAFASSADTTVGHGSQTWCAVNPECNGWGEWLRRINAGEKNLITSPAGSMN